jgi:hypothetical protein
MQKAIRKERVFTVELNSKQNLKNFALTNGGSDTVLIEGSIGGLIQATFAEGVVLEVIGKKGTLRVDLGENEIKSRQQESVEVKQQ